MTDQWYYGRGADISGPVTGQQLLELANTGQLLRTDTVWLEANETGVPAKMVKNLFPPADGSAGPEFRATDGSTSLGIEETPVSPDPAPAATPMPDVASPRPERAGRASVGKGAVILSQDGKTVKYRGKCTTCGREDSSWKSIPIPRGTVRAGFFCAKCRKRRDVEIHGIH
jgi:hypothetical protein